MSDVAVDGLTESDDRETLVDDVSVAMERRVRSRPSSRRDRNNHDQRTDRRIAKEVSRCSVH